MIFGAYIKSRVPSSFYGVRKHCFYVYGFVLMGTSYPVSLLRFLFRDACLHPFLSALGCARRLFLFSNNPKVTFPLLSSRFLLLPFGCIAKIKCNIKAPQYRSQAYRSRTYRADCNTQNHQMELILFLFSSKYKFFPFFGTPKFLMEPCFFPGIPAAVKNHKAYILSI